MVKCPFCQSEVDETTQSKCGICFAPIGVEPVLAATPAPAAMVPLAAAPAAGYAAPQLTVPQGVARVSLTGEIIVTEAPPPPPPNLNGPRPQGGTHAHPSPSAPVTHAVTRSPYRSANQSREASPSRKQANAMMINMVVILLLVGGAAGGGYWKWMNRTNPKSQVERYVHAIQWLDWGVVYDLSATPPGNMSRGQFIDKLDEPYDNNGVIKIAARKALESITYSVGEPTINGVEATVPVSIGGSTVTLKLKNFGGIWKIQPHGTNPLGILHGAYDDE